ncbi:MAG TPA: AIR synthase-related protein, partial [Planctomycetota bacterium]|nr:AIR synthase-related protein [Planctomycetota bacterium]
MYWRETGDATPFHGIAQDSIVMNVDDLLCVGVTGGMVISSTINRNARNIPGVILAALITGTERVLAGLRKAGVEIRSGGGETADVGDLTKTFVADTTIFARWPRKKIIAGTGIKPGLVIVGLGSAGQASYETAENSGIGSNGLTSARHDLLSKYYARKYPETYDAATPAKLAYCGKFKMNDRLPGSRLTIGQALLSPTRSYAPILKPLLDHHFDRIAGLIHCSGGGQTKCLRFGQKAHFVKDALMPVPPMFACIQETTKTPWREMFQVFNMGHRMEVYCQEAFAATVIATAKKFNVAAQVIGHTEKSKHGGKNHLTIGYGGQAHEYGI